MINLKQVEGPVFFCLTNRRPAGVLSAEGVPGPGDRDIRRKG